MAENDDPNFMHGMDEGLKSYIHSGIIGILIFETFSHIIALDRFYISPEARKNFEYGYKSDIWNVGIIAFFLLSGNLPFDTLEDLENNYYED